VRLVFDVTPLSHPLTGIGNYMLGMLGGIAEASEGRHELVFFAPTGPQNRHRVRAALNGIPGERKIVPVPPPSNLWRGLWSRVHRIPVERFVGSLDAFHFSDWMYPPQRGGMRTTTVHDLGPIHFPEWVDSRTRRLHVPKALHAAKTCDLLFANSRYTADDVVRTLGVTEDRVVVAYPGIHARYLEDGPRAERPAPYLLTTATSEPRKNLKNLLAAFALLRARRPELELLVVGEKHEKPPGGARFLGYVAAKDLPALYRGAEAFVFPSLFEGFGIPVVEAMASGIPTVVSTHNSLDEASGDAAIRVDPLSPDEIASGIETALTEGRTLVPRGLEHARKFTWRACGEAMLRGYESARD
jgi:glycosyltransferase involved in cell wall biosynthesis